jgi:predicted aldo/keto reductase-like oxidoreductase
MYTTNRRDFLRHTLAVGSAAALPGIVWPAQVRRANDVIEIGPTKVRMSRLCCGTGTFGAGHSSNQMRKLGADGLADLFWDAYDNGVFVWDTADGYGSHAAVKVALKKLPREKVTILTKTDARTPEQLKPALERYFQEMGSDYIDIVLLHSRMSPKWDELDKGLMDILSEAKEAKKVRAVGISCHSIEAMKVAAKSPWLDVCLCRLNPAGVRMEAPTEEVLPFVAAMKAAGKGLIAMKPLGEGQLRDRVDEALRFAATKDAVHCFSVGMESRDELKDIIARIPKVSQPA